MTYWAGYFPVFVLGSNFLFGEVSYLMTQKQEYPEASLAGGAGFGQQLLMLRYRPPFNWEKLIGFFEARVVPQMERVEKGRYQRLIRYGDVPGWFEVSLADDHQVKVQFQFAKPVCILDFIQRIKDMLDLDADPLLIEQDLSKDKKLKPLIEKHSGLRIPGGIDGFELAVRAIVGQLISVKAARTLLERLVVHCGEQQNFDDSIGLTHFFPTPQNILEADLSEMGFPKLKVHTLKALAQGVLAGDIVLDRSADYEETCRQLLAIKGIGPWTVAYLSLRCLKNPDAFPESDLEIRKKIAAYDLDASLWSPWRAYATILLFSLE